MQADGSSLPRIENLVNKRSLETASASHRLFAGDGLLNRLGGHFRSPTGRERAELSVTVNCLAAER